MMFRLTFIATLMALWGCQYTADQVARGSVYVVDGDTIRTNGGSIRLLGFNTPETHGAKCERERALGYKAKEMLSRRITSGQTIELDYKRKRDGNLRRDRYGRLLAALVLDGQDIAPFMVTSGLAEPYDGGKRRNWC